MPNPADMLEFIRKHHTAGRTVYLCTPLRITKLAPKHADMVRLSNDGRALLVQHGKQWVDYTYTTLRAQ